MSVSVPSEIGRLRSVLVHSPGPELVAVTPDTRHHYLYDDIIDVDSARREHRSFVALLQRFCEVRFVGDLLRDIADRRDVRELLMRETMAVIPSDPLARELMAVPGDALVRYLIEGFEEPPGPLGQFLNEAGYSLPPLPNLVFTRDVAMAINESVVIGSMRYGVRWSEELLMKALFLHHPLLASEGVLYDGSAERRPAYTLEGGDVHPLRRDTILIGFSERSSAAAIDHLVQLVFARTAVENVVVVVMPKESTAIHLDMIFTQVDRELCVVHPPAFIGPERLPVLLWRKGTPRLREMPNLFSALAECGLLMEPVFCGGTRRILQEREQWSSGCNFVAVRPGVVLSYSRNEATLRAMEQAGFCVIAGADVTDDSTSVSDGARAVLTFDGHELVRGGGGPRCMTCPLERDDPWA